MTNKKTKHLIILLFTVIIGLIIALTSVIYINDNKSQQIDIQSYQKKIDILTAQLQEEKSAPDNNNIVIENVCTNFLEAYYTVNDSSSRTITVEKCKAYCTDSLFSIIVPEQSGYEYSDNEIDLVYSSNIVIHNTYYSFNNPENVIADCTINKNVNGMKSSNKYFVELTVSNTGNEWLVDNFELISVQGG